MKIRFALAALALGSAAMLPSALAEESLDGKGVVEAKFDAKAKKVNIVIKGKSDGIYVNKDYPLKCTLKAKDGGKVDKTELKKEDAKYEDVAGKAGKAKTATFSVGADKNVEGECKMVVCSDSACSSPFKVSFTSN
ncbi:MAG: hypothetical protein HOW73_24600 [Polyangiaceae bacterium]|nr:hypothetical protein [Polyangiaceae bacterium]